MQEDKDTEEYVEYLPGKNDKRDGSKEKWSGFMSGPFFVPVIIVLIAIIAFSLGRISGLEDKREQVRVISGSGEVRGASVDNAPQPKNDSSLGATSLNSSGQVVASKNGTKYHYPWCAGAKQISEKNKITFNSIEEARAAGYTPASNCKGLK